MTTGRAIVLVAEWSSQSPRSMISAFSLSNSTTARRTVHTLIGSYVALRTSTRPTSRPRRRCSGGDADQTGAGIEVAITGASVPGGYVGSARLVSPDRKGSQHAQHLD